MKRKIAFLACLLALIAGLYGSIRLYYRVTDGFSIGNISSDFAYNSRWQTSSLKKEEQAELDKVFSQAFYYMGKGCQSYVFLSEDGTYIIKFFKYQRFRTQPWLELFSFIPAVHEYQLIKSAKKINKLEGVFQSYKIAFEHLKPQSQLVYVHLNKSDHLNRKLVIYDKMGLKHELELDRFEFFVQRKATMLCPYIQDLMNQGREEEAKILLSRLIHLVVSEYQQGIADNDHALMQNTGVYNGAPIHVDIGQFVVNNQARNPSIYKQELFSKTYLLRAWLKEHYPQLLEDFETQLHELIGPDFFQMKPYFKPHD